MKTAEVSIVTGAILRTPDSLRRQIWAPAPLTLEAPEFAKKLSDLDGVSSPELVPFQPEGGRRERALWAAWESLAPVRVWNTETLVAVLMVLIETLPASFGTQPVPYPFTPAMQRDEIAPTAAHPRAYQGTKHKPGKGKTPAPVDVRSILCDPAAVSELILLLAPFWDDAVSEVYRLGYPAPAFASPELDPYTAWNHEGQQAVLMPDVTPGFRTLVLPALRGRPWSEVERLHTLFLSHRLDDRPEVLHATTCMLLANASVDQVQAWLEIILSLPRDQQAGFAGLVLTTRAYLVDVEKVSGGFRESILECTVASDFAYRPYCLLRALALGLDYRYVVGGFQLADTINGRVSSRSFHEITSDGYFPIDSVLDLAAYLNRDADFEDWRLSKVWEVCGTNLYFGTFFAARQWERWSPSVAQALLRVYLTPFYEDFRTDQNGKWQAIQVNADLIKSSLGETASEYRRKFCDSLGDYIEYSETSKMDACSVRNAIRLLSRLCRPPHHVRRTTTFVWLKFLAHLSPTQQDELLAAPESSLAQLEKACRTPASETHTGRGIGTLCELVPAFSLDAFFHTPSRLLRTAKTLGCLPNEERTRVVSAFERGPVMQTDVAHLGDEAAYAYIATQRDKLRNPPIPSVLYAHYAGESALNQQRLAHYHALMRLQWKRACLESLEDMILENLARGYGIDEMNEAAYHALQLERGTQENRRALRKFLSAYWGGSEDYIEKHPATQQWLRKHPRIKLDLWTTGIGFRGETPEHGSVTISLETFPLEALKLGTHVGSCLSLGGNFEFSAAATVLDLNKQVLYARDGNGAVVGRQVVAYSEAGELVCFSIYPVSASDEIQALFAECNQAFAAALGIPIFQRQESSDGKEIEYTIALILSHGWWDDGHWEREGS